MGRQWLPLEEELGPERVQPPSEPFSTLLLGCDRYVSSQLNLKLQF